MATVTEFPLQELEYLMDAFVGMLAGPNEAVSVSWQIPWIPYFRHSADMNSGVNCQPALNLDVNFLRVILMGSIV
jgi:hypothetical protein